MEGGFLNNYHCDIYKNHEICFKNFNYKDLTQKKKEYIEDQSCKLAIENPKLAYIDIYCKKYQYNLTTPIMLCLFGFDQNTNQMCLQFSNRKVDSDMLNFYEFIQNLEYNQMKYIGLDEDNCDLYNSQIRQDKDEKYDPYLIVKVPFRHNKYEVDILNKDNSYQSIQNIYNFTKMRCDIFIDKIWKYNEKYVCKWKIKKIELV